MLDFIPAPGKTNISVTDGLPPPLWALPYTSAQVLLEWLYMKEQPSLQLSGAASGPDEAEHWAKGAGFKHKHCEVRQSIKEKQSPENSENQCNVKKLIFFKYQ